MDIDKNFSKIVTWTWPRVDTGVHRPLFYIFNWTIQQCKSNKHCVMSFKRCKKSTFWTFGKNFCFLNNQKCLFLELRENHRLRSKVNFFSNYQAQFPEKIDKILSHVLLNSNLEPRKFWKDFWCPYKNLFSKNFLPSFDKFKL